MEKSAPQTACHERSVGGRFFACRRRACALHFWTDVEEYFQSTLELIRDPTTQFEGPLPVPEREKAEHDVDFRTHFEGRTRLHGESVFRSEFRKPIACAVC